MSVNLSLMAKHASQQGMGVSRSGVYNVMAPPRKNSTCSACRSIIQSRPGGLVAKEKEFHPRGIWSATKMKHASEFLTSQRAAGFTTAQVHVDATSKAPIYITARDKAKVRGFTLRRSDGEPGLTGCGHSYPLANRRLLRTSAVSHCEVPDNASEEIQLLTACKLVSVLDGKPATDTLKAAIVQCNDEAEKRLGSMACVRQLTAVDPRQKGIDAPKEILICTPIRLITYTTYPSAPITQSNSERVAGCVVNAIHCETRLYRLFSLSGPGATWAILIQLSVRSRIPS